MDVMATQHCAAVPTKRKCLHARLSLVFVFWCALQVEYMLMELDDKDEKARLVLNGGEILDTLQDQGENINPK